jgi:hypothetical protein
LHFTVFFMCTSCVVGVLGAWGGFIIPSKQ